MEQEIVLNTDELLDLVGYWQGRLRLKDWDFGVLLAKKEEIEDGRAGENHIDYENHFSGIRILKHEDWADSYGLQDMERTLVHEMLHVLFLPLDPGEKGSIKQMHFEYVVENLARALIAERRKTLK